MKVRTTLRWIVPLALLFLFGCQQMNVPGSSTLDTTAKKITVIDNPEDSSYDESLVNTLVKLDDVRGMDWLSEEEILVDRENRETGTPEKIEGGEWYPHNIYIQSLQTGTQTPLLAANEHQGFAQVSPDRMRVFYKTFYSQSNTGKGYFLDLTSMKEKAFTEEDAMEVQSGRWIDNDSVVYATIDGKIYMASADSHEQPRLLLDSAIPFVNNVAYMDGMLYYSALKGTLFANTLTGKSVALPINNVVWMVPSPDEQRLAVVNRTKSGRMELLITDLQGNVLKAIAQDNQIYGTAWSPDGNSIAYAGITDNGTVRGIYLADLVTGLSMPLTVDVKFIADPLHWSPTGTRLMVSTTQPDEKNKRNRFVTFLLRVNSNVSASKEATDQ
ncbi:TolB family protein [Cohnella lupini]|uniref:TolB protein n=1 Tax=Cohnella lupini TaxID=1294267 RepID=A0A3D9I5S6_9BACL|nr:PD40 domain-containing protein [Cohnella lupini]RED57124.1 TolB protein [Cohnella lupini]